MADDLKNSIFHDDDKAREWLEARVWPSGPVCPHCRSVRPARMGGKSGRPGLYHCPDCRRQFTVTVGTVFERSKIALPKWLMALYLLNSSKKGVSSNQIHCVLGVSYKAAWFMIHRIREAMKVGETLR
jgi:transposase-like protein